MSVRSGELAMRPLPAVLLDLHEDLATGKLLLRRGRVSKSVDLVNGNPVSSTSTPRDETLGHFLVANAVITEEQHTKAVERAASTGGKLGEALVAMSVVSVEQLIEQLGRQARHKIVQALRWPQGAWRFDDTAEAVAGIQLRMVEVVLDGLRETEVEDLSRLARLDGMRFTLTPRGKQLKSELKRAYPERVMQLLDAGAAVDELERCFPDRAHARLALDAMVLCDAVEATVAHGGLGIVTGVVPDFMKLTTSSRHRGVPIPVLADVRGGSDRIPVELTAPLVARAPSRPQLAGAALFDMLFEDLAEAAEGAAPIDFEEQGAEDSGVVSLEELENANVVHDHEGALREQLAAEHQRVQGADHYAVLMISRKATPQEIDAAHVIRGSMLEHLEAGLADARDRAKLAEIRAAYQHSRGVLADFLKRNAYDRELAGGELVQVAPSIDAEMSFRMAEELMERSQWDAAIGHIRKVIAQAPGEADYQAALGWVEWMVGRQQPGAADLARGHLNRALEINQDHAAAHEYKGRIDAALKDDDAEALFHLERAVDLDPTRQGAITAIETLMFARGELRRYERVLKRLLFRLRGKGTQPEGKAWTRLAKLYLDHLNDPVAAAAAVANATRINPRDTDAMALVARLGSRPAEPIRVGWREALADPRAGAALVASTQASGHVDAAFLAASSMVAMDTADASMRAMYEQHRVHGVALPSEPLGRDQWAALRHRDDSVEIGGLIELVAPAIHALSPMTLADSELDASLRVDDADLARGFVALRDRCAALLGVPAAPVYSQVELGTQIHVVASDPPVLVAGDEALMAPDRTDMVFRLVRAMTFLWPGRAVGASRPARVLKAVVMAVFREASATDLGAEDSMAEAAAAALAALPDEVRVQARAAALRLLSRGTGLNLSQWARSLSRTADRTGMLFCGDVPAAFAGARESGDLDRDLVDFAFSAAHVQLRAAVRRR